MNTCYVMGGLGNQLFQIFAIMGYSIKNKMPAVFQYQKTHNDPRPVYWENILLAFKKYTIATPLYGAILYKEPRFEYDELPEISNEIRRNGLMIHGYFQSYKYFENEFENIMDIMQYNKFKIRVRQKVPYLDFDDSISMHFRLGDYKNLPNHHPIMPLEYYEKSLQVIIDKKNKKDCKVYYFCENEDISTVNNKIKLLKDKFPELVFEKIDSNLADWEQMVIMSCCENHIIANSSFSWWGAYFNNKKHKIVCYPTIWFGPAMSNHKIHDLFPPSWTKIQLN